MKKYSIKVFSSLIFVFLSLLISAQVMADIWEDLNEEEFRENDVEEFVWKEGDSSALGYPEESDLVEVSGSSAYRNYQYLIDVESVQVGADGVVRYSLVIRSSSGSDNAFFEGIRCISNEIKTYAYGAADMDDKKKFVPRIKPGWKKASSSGVRGYSETFIINYLCGFNGKNIKRYEIIQNIKYGKGEVDGTYN